jgi:membrane-associated phospholipid phosphatase
MTSTTVLSWITNFGDAGLTIPVAAGCALWLSTTDKREALVWLATLAGALALVGANKILYAGCGIEIRSIDFRVISGHTMLTSAVWGVTFGLLAGSRGVRWYRLGAVAGLALGALIGFCRVVQDAHTPIEVVAGWFLGGGIALFFLRRFFKQPRKMPGSIFAGLGLLAVSTIAYGHHAPIQQILVAYSPWLCRWFDF